MEAGISPQQSSSPMGACHGVRTRVVTKWFCLEDSAEAECLRTPGMERLYLDRTRYLPQLPPARQSSADGLTARITGRWFYSAVPAPVACLRTRGPGMAGRGHSSSPPPARGPFRIGDGYDAGGRQILLFGGAPVLSSRTSTTSRIRGPGMEPPGQRSPQALRPRRAFSASRLMRNPGRFSSMEPTTYQTQSSRGPGDAWSWSSQPQH